MQLIICSNQKHLVMTFQQTSFHLYSDMRTALINGLSRCVRICVDTFPVSKTQQLIYDDCLDVKTEDCLLELFCNVVYDSCEQ